MCKDLIFKYILPAVLAASLCLINGRSNAADENCMFYEADAHVFFASVIYNASVK